MNVGQAQNANNVILIGIIYCKEMGDSISFMPSPWGLLLIFFFVCVFVLEELIKADGKGLECRV